jgi:peptidoglycan/LPS O-acetylase OafA/YrhL
LILYRADIDGLRAIAILSVVLFHIDSSLLPGGFTGVDIFFVISGYLISKIIISDLQAERFTFFNFWMRRARRILPALLFMLGTVSAVAFILLLPDDLKSYAKLLLSSLWFTANIRLADEKGYFDPEDQNNPLLHVWSLSVEEQYYLLWPALLVLAWRKLDFKWRVAGLGLLLGVSLGFSEWASHYYPKQAFFNLASRAFELLIGAAIAIYQDRLKLSRRAAQMAGALGGVLIGSSFALISEQTRFPGFAALLPCLGAALLLLSGTAGNTITTASLLSSRVLVGIGRISYSWYLWHWPPLAFLRYYFDRPLVWPEILLALAIGFAMTMVSWRFVEQPFRGTAEPSRFKRRFLPGAIVASLALFALGATVTALKGAPQRLGSEAAALLQDLTKKVGAGCVGAIREVGSLQVCEFGRPAVDQASVLLWGDSHANHYLPAMNYVAAAQGVTGLAYITNGCLPFIAPEATLYNPRKNCKQANDATLALLKTRPDLSVVVLAARWSGGAPLSAGDARLSIFKRNLIETIAALQGMGKTVIVLGQVPTIPFRADDCMLRKVQLNQASRNCEYYPTSRVVKNELLVADVVNEVSAAHGIGQAYFPNRQFCDEMTCRVVNEANMPLYRDNNHLTERGALYLAPYIARAIGDLKPRQGRLVKGVGLLRRRE